MLLAKCHSYILDATIAEALAAAALAGIKVHVMPTARASGDPVPVLNLIRRSISREIRWSGSRI